MNETNNSSRPSTPLTVTMDMLPLIAALNGLQTSISNFGNSFAKVKIDFNSDLGGAIKSAVAVAQTQMKEFVTSTVTQMNKEVTKVTYGTNGKPHSTTVTTTTLDQSAHQSGVAFEKSRLAAINEYNGLVKQQKITFDDFASAIRKVTDRFMSISDLYSEGDKAVTVDTLSKNANATYEEFLTATSMIKNGGGASEAVAQQLAVRVFNLLDGRNSKDPQEREKFNQNKAIQVAKENNPQFAELLNQEDQTKVDKALLFKEFSRGLALAYNNPQTNKYDFTKMLNQYVDPNAYLQNLFKFPKEGLNPDSKPPKSSGTPHDNDKNQLYYQRGDFNGLYEKSRSDAKIMAPTIGKNVESSTTKGQTDDDWAANHALSAAMSQKMLDDLAIWQQKMLKEHPEAIAIINAVAAFTSGIINVIEGLMDFKSALGAIVTFFGIKKMFGGGKNGPGPGGPGGGGLGGGLGCCCPCGPETQRAAQGVAGMASSFTASMLGAILGGMFSNPEAKPTPDHVMANTTSPAPPDHVMANTPSSVPYEQVPSSYHASMGNLGVPYQPEVSKEDHQQDSKGLSNATKSALLIFGAVVMSAVAAATIEIPVVDIVTTRMAAGMIGMAIASTSTASAKEKGGKANIPSGSKQGILEHSPPENVKALVKPVEMNRASRNLNDSLELKNQPLCDWGKPITSNGMDIEWAKRNQTITQTITNHQIFHMNFNGNILQDPPSLTKNVASAMGSKAVASGGYINLGARGTIA